MSAPTLAQIRQGLATALAVIPNVQVSAYMLANPTPPALHVFPGGNQEITFDLAMARGLDRWPFTVQGMVGAPSDEGAQILLDTLLAPAGATSVKAALEADRTLGGVVQTLRVMSIGAYRVYVTEGRAPILGAEWAVEIFATGA